MAIAYNTSIVRNGLVLHIDAANPKSYPGTGTVWTDLSGSANTGTLVGGTLYQSANNGFMTFGGVNDYVNCGSNASLNITNNITVEAWVYINTFVNTGGIVTFGSFGNEGEQYSLSTSSSSNRITFSTNWPAAWQIGYSTTLQPSTWYQLVATFSSGNWIIYVNGVANTSGTFAITSFPSVVNPVLTLGVNQPGGDEYFNGRISTARIYNRVLSPAEIFQNFDAHRGRFGI